MKFRYEAELTRKPGPANGPSIQKLNVVCETYDEAYKQVMAKLPSDRQVKSIVTVAMATKDKSEGGHVVY